ncbi:secreted protein [Candidatus Thiomargarita nelsonii]|uniref:Secreted protein n=1 Tax=Candidatus Thiomargarita nelsonii TaxID=1003181 RepID=A0A176S4Y5_9GAMM|nr:secreted protein [Candidatus Thiomargarita nelsonii]
MYSCHRANIIKSRAIKVKIKFFLIEPHIFFKASSNYVEGVNLTNIRRKMKTQHLMAFALIMGLNTSYSSAVAQQCTATVANNLDIHIPAAIYQPESGEKLNLWAELKFSGTDADGNLI